MYCVISEHLHEFYNLNSFSGWKGLTKFIPRDFLNSTLIYILFSLVDDDPNLIELITLVPYFLKINFGPWPSLVLCFCHKDSNKLIIWLSEYLCLSVILKHVEQIFSTFTFYGSKYFPLLLSTWANIFHFYFLREQIKNTLIQCMFNTDKARWYFISLCGYFLDQLFVRCLCVSGVLNDVHWSSICRTTDWC